MHAFSVVKRLAVDWRSIQDDFNTDPWIGSYTVKQSDRNSSKADIFHEPTPYEQHIQTSSEQKK